MVKIPFSLISLGLAASLLLGCASTENDNKSASDTQGANMTSPTAYVAVPKNKDNDLRLFYADGKLLKGSAAMDRMPQDADLTLWLAGNQFFAMEDVVRSFQKQHPDINVGVITLPPGLILKAIQAGGWRYQGKDYPGQPDLYGSVNIGHLKALKKAGLMDQYMIYMHNELQIMVAKGNPKHIQGIDDLARPDVRTSMPNPLTEGIMKFYAKPVLERHGIWDRISGGKECQSCQTTPNNWFTAVHHRETPERIQDDRADAGIVWKTEVLEAVRHGARVEGIALPPADSLVNEVAYAIGPLKTGAHQDTAMQYLAFLATAAAQDAYAKYGFVRAKPEELRPQSLAR
ncbi:substrate-binding domain-containing protein [Thermithiobacillus plumbiphilus]|uniref:Substrate-binding domain-containing protein n=1 Tax=Thermithiobacillus plumbiphilus TaxID=1729899 RepID=A0ABU9D7Y4_9PROT